MPNTQQTQETSIHALREIQTSDTPIVRLQTYSLDRAQRDRKTKNIISNKIINQTQKLKEHR
jgi:hypothetical protein